MNDRVSIGALALLLALSVPGLVAARGDGETKEADERTEVHPSGFLGDYSELRPQGEKKGMLIYVKETGVLASYNRFLLDPLQFVPHPLSETDEIDPDEVQMLAEFFRDETIEQLTEGGYGVVEEPGPGVARIRAAITDIVPVDPKKNVGVTAAGAAVGVGLLLPRVDLGQADIEVEILDSASGERLVALVATRGGKRFGGKIKGAKRWGDVKSAFKKWAKDFRKQLDEVHRGAAR
jgi:hypothetical protein